MTKKRVSKVNNKVLEKVRKSKEAKKVKVSNKDTKIEQKSKLKKLSFAKVKDKKMYELNNKLAKSYIEYINKLNKNELFNLLELHEFDIDFWKVYIKDKQIDNKEKLCNLVISLCKYLYFENDTFLKQLKNKNKDKDNKDNNKVKVK